MDVNPLKPFLLAVFLCSLIFSVNTAKADGWFYFDPVKIEAVIKFDGSYRRDDASNKAQDTNWEAGLRLQQDAYFLDPGIAKFSFDLQPAYSWKYFKYETDQPLSLAAADEDFNGHYLSYAIQASLFRDMPLPFKVNLGAFQSSNINTGSLGSRYKSDSASWNANIIWENTPFPISLTYDQIDFVQSNLSGSRGRLTERDELLKRWAIRGQSSKTRLDIEHLVLDDRIEYRQQDYVTDKIDLNHGFLWGRNSRLSSRLNYYDRSGFNANDRFSLEESVYIQHAEKLSSNSRYRFVTGGQAFTTTEHFGEFRLQHRLYNNLSTYTRTGAAYRQSSGLNETAWQTELGTQYQKADMFGAAVNAGFSLNYGETDRDSSRLLVEVLDEAHIVPLNGFILLNSRYILAPTIIVTNDDGTVVFVEGADYVVLDEADGLTQLQILPGGRILTGDTILVSYKALALPSQQYSTTITSYNLGISLGWVSANHTHRTLNNRRISGASEFFLQDDVNDTTNLEFRWKMSNVSASVSASRNYRLFGDYDSTSYVFTQALAWQYRGSQWDLVLLESFSDTDDRRNDMYNLTLTTGWNPLPNLSILSRLGVWKTIDETFSENTYKLDDTYASIGINMQWRYRNVTLNLDYQHNQRSTIRQNGVERRTLDDRLAFNLTRRFR